MSNQHEIVAWAKEAFPDAELTDVYNKLNDELLELDDAIWGQWDAQVPSSELADVAILLYQLADYCGVDLDQAVRDKLAVNKARTWTPVGDGTYQHEEAAS